MKPLPPGSVIGILGGGQLGRLMALDAARLGFAVHVYCPEANAPALQVCAKSFRGAYDDVAALTGFAATCDVVTYEFENVPAACAEAILATSTPVLPSKIALEKSQDRLLEKQFLNGIGVETVSFEAVTDLGDLTATLDRFGGEGVLKRRRDGYDGKGQMVIKGGFRDEDAAGLLSAPCILEALCPFDLEISVIMARTAGGETVAFDPPHNVHQSGVLHRSILPAPITDAVASKAIDATRALADALDYVGVLALEFFVCRNGRLIANEFAPRVHNSGHWTPDACLTGQFEQHIRAISGWPLGPVKRLFDIEMRNLFGDEVLTLPSAFASDARLVSYGKKDPRPGRKMGHVTLRI